MQSVRVRTSLREPGERQRGHYEGIDEEPTNAIRATFLEGLKGLGSKTQQRALLCRIYSSLCNPFDYYRLKIFLLSTEDYCFNLPNFTISR